jgi:hypothetical protein
MKTEAYICDYKNHLVTAEAAFGITPTEDLFDRQASFPIVNNPARANIHCCTDCYREAVLIPASHLVDRKKEGEAVYQLKIKELGYAFRWRAVRDYHTRQQSAKKNKK